MSPFLCPEMSLNLWLYMLWGEYSTSLFPASRSGNRCRYGCLCLQVGEQVQVWVLLDHRVGHQALGGIFFIFIPLPRYRLVGVQGELFQVNLSVDVLQQHLVVGSWVFRDQLGYRHGVTGYGFTAPFEVGSSLACFALGSDFLAGSANAVGVNRWSILFGRVGIGSGVLAGARVSVRDLSVSASVLFLGSSPLPQAADSAMARAITPAFMRFLFMSFSTPFSPFTPGSRGAAGGSSQGGTPAQIINPVSIHLL